MPCRGVVTRALLVPERLALQPQQHLRLRQLRRQRLVLRLRLLLGGLLE